MQHPDDRHLQLFVAAQLDKKMEERIEEHLDACPECMKRVFEMECKPQDALIQQVKAVTEAYGDDNSSGTVAEVIRSLQGGRPVSSQLAPGDILNENLRIEAKLGRGGMGEAWKAFDTLGKRHVVLKFVPGDMQHQKEAMDSVRSSFQRIHALQHQHICPVHVLIDDPDHGIYVVMKYIDGMTLREYRQSLADKNAGISFSDAVQILWAVAKGLDYAHERNVIHRDIKPGNIMIGRTDGVQIIDFGLAQNIRTDTSSTGEATMEVSGTRPYMAPEQWQGDLSLQDARTDQYALAVTAYELIAGYRPFHGCDADTLHEQVQNASPEPIPGIPEHVNAALIKALSKKREERFPNCKSFVKALAAQPKAGQEDVASPSSGYPGLPPDRSSEILTPSIWVPHALESLSLISSSSAEVEQKKVNRSRVWRIVLGTCITCTAIIVLFFWLRGPFLAQSPPSNVVVPTFTGELEKPQPTKTPPIPEEPVPSETLWPDEEEFVSASPTFLRLKDEIEAEIKEKGGVAVVGQVLEKDGTPMENTPTNRRTYLVTFNDQDTHRFNKGWFITPRQDFLPNGRLRVSTLEHEEIMMQLQNSPGKIHFRRIYLDRLPKEKLVELRGSVQDEKGRPIAYAELSLSILPPSGSFLGGHVPPIKIVADSKGQYAFPGVPPQTYHLYATSPQYGYISNRVRLGNDQTKPTSIEKNNKFFQQDGEKFVITVPFQRKVTIDTLYQPDGSTDFTKDNVIKGQYELLTVQNFDIARGDKKIGGAIAFNPTEKSREHDLRLLFDGKLEFSHSYRYYNAGNYDLGEVDFDSVKEADPAKITRYDSPCLLNHVYVVRTFKLGHYAKMIVRSIEEIDPSTEGHHP